MPISGRAARTVFWHYILVYLVLSILLDILGIRLLSTVVGLALSGAQHSRSAFGACTMSTEAAG
jgi:uncharacterized membrane protein YhaH (DUF805 family)